MKASYTDITSRIAQTPCWWDINGVPRYSEPHPDDCPSIYADRVAFLLIACQNCSHEFTVEIHTDSIVRASRARLFEEGDPRREEACALGAASEWEDTTAVNYGDPPNIGCCASGPTMTSDTIEVLSVWDRVRRAAGPPWELVGGTQHATAEPD